ncbi:MAG TPA: hypothetical protein VFM18_18840 [Methanosarcina sp.]|nr:hypothetical protein [Methanosarcina sp.]
MITLYAVATIQGGYAREDAGTANVDGIYSDANNARIHAMVVHGKVVPVVLDQMPAGIIANAKEIGLLK